jgi:ribosomal protein S18 acetylase RimI-like enzyme
MQHTDYELRHAESAEDIRACYAVMAELRPHLEGADDFAARVERMRAQQYRLLAVWQGGAVVALAGYRLQENTVYGRFLYVDDLVAGAASRGQGFGARLLAALSDEAAQAGCVRLVLDTGLSNALAQRFYFREGLLTGAIRFHKVLNGA